MRSQGPQNRAKADVKRFFAEFGGPVGTTLGTVLELRRTGTTANGAVITGNSEINGHLVVNSGSSNTILTLRNTLESAGWDLVADADNVLKFSLSGTGTILQLEDDRVDIPQHLRLGTSFANNNHPLYIHQSETGSGAFRLDTERYGIYIDALNDTTPLSGYSLRMDVPNSGRFDYGNHGGLGLTQSTYGYGFISDCSNDSAKTGYSFKMFGATKAFQVNNDNTITLGAFDVDYSGNRLTITNGSSDRVIIQNDSTVETPCLHLSSINRTTGRAFGLVVISHDTSGYDNGGAYHAKYYSGASVKYQVLVNGNVQNANNSYGALSDSKLKHTITDSNPQLDKLMNVRIVDYFLNEDLDAYQTKKKGVIAQELEQHFPSLVETIADLDQNNNDLGTTTKSVKYSVFIPILIKALQEANQKIIDLEARVSALEQP